ncbi:Yip1 domain [Musa troglodytarum]|uniref:Yip1 domain n=1 Tax=Musa troglodytarum TaxID=320322 RepID=A0A9E7FUE0_9LILI|nr:Yip1 domain [Musa troglodytarum]
MEEGYTSLPTSHLLGSVPPYLQTCKFFRLAMVDTYHLRVHLAVKSKRQTTGKDFVLFLVVPSEIFRWIIIILAGSASSWFVYLNLKVSTEGSDATPLVVSALALQFALALFIKIFFFS